ncbi:aspartate/glutamate racemase family protein [Andreprevotia chitinilytica]|uniref:aspartate/glutamate racemase family protein n=1 Tax=Andreprevotia chitinilytica TaxID=396808 RepID=UPI0005566224|nr:aspartate/glutamate racemase family protein [Andreprevotia chitinilytica]
MKTIGLLGGMSWESSALYYRAINEGIRQRLGGHHSARSVLYSVDFEAIKALQYAGQWDEAAALLADAAQNVEKAGADFLLICTNTMHKVADQIQAAISIPIIHLADATAERIKQQGITTVGLLGTRFTMAEDFYKGRLAERHGLQVIVPSPADQDIVHQIIYDELCQGIVREESRRAYLRIIDTMRAAGAQGVIEGCTEIVMLIQQAHTDVPLFDTTAIHAERAVELALAA